MAPTGGVGIPQYLAQARGGRPTAHRIRFTASFISTLNQSTDRERSDSNGSGGTPTQCTGGNVPTGILASGNATGCFTPSATVAWNGIGAQAGALSVTDGGGYNSTWTSPTAPIWIFNNNNTATSGANYNAWIFEYRVSLLTRYRLSSGCVETRAISRYGSHPTSLFTFGHAGSSGFAAVAVPNLNMQVHRAARRI